MRQAAEAVRLPLPVPLLLICFQILARRTAIVPGKGTVKAVDRRITDGISYLLNRDVPSHQHDSSLHAQPRNKLCKVHAGTALNDAPDLLFIVVKML